ncbi:hypothetical protein C0995_007483 [Termitomyces sp. Mi166|nr:hypothetical protein C0995_007483 [Termitomyces sp. Mi166\
MQKQGISKKQKKTVQDESTPIGANFSQLEYAIERRILETPLLELSYFFDVTGEVPALSDYHENIGAQSVDIGNGDVAPEWGFDIIINGGVLRYGPWADRQRAELQKVFFPPTYHDGEVTASLKPGDKRLWTALQVFVELRDNTVLHIPFREPSKLLQDWQWDGQSEIPQKSRVREATAIHVNVGDRSSMSYILPMVTGPAGYRPVLEVHLDTVVVTSSLNDIQMVTSESCRIHCEMPAPLKWNEERKWLVALTLRQPVLYLIRDHINMFIDLGKDWTTGPPSDYQRYIPMIYAFEIVLHHYELNVYVNDHNIIDKPLLRDENALLSLRGAHFNVMTDILSNEFRPECTTIPFTIDVPDSSLNLSLPRWNINALHAPRGGNSLANIHSLHVAGSYQYFAETRPDYVEQLKLKFNLRDVAFKNLGWSIRYFMVFRENYLGSFTHFVTLYEYLDRRKKKQPLGDPVLSKYRPGKNNMLQTEMQVFIDGGTVIMPAGLPGYSLTREENDSSIGNCLILTLPNVQLQFRMHDHYMEMSLNVSSISGGLIQDYPEKVTYNKEALKASKDILYIDGLDITANRLFGPQPRTATYVCIWEVNLGPTKVLLSASQGRLLAAAGNAFRLNFVDALNAPASEYLLPVDPDGQPLETPSFDMTWRASLAALVIDLPREIKLDSNDLGGRFHRKLTSVKIPEIHVKLLLTSRPHGGRWLETANFSADAYADIYTAPRGYREMAQAQIFYIAGQDHLTGRARRMVASLGSQNVIEHIKSEPHRNGLYLPHPTLPERCRLGVPANLTRVEYTRKPRRNVVQLSDSDTEERISEADRDARLAKTRSSTPVPLFVCEDDQSMSSGDESDDEDLTDASSDSDWSEFADTVDSDFDPERATLKRYSHVTRHYMAHLESPNLWDGCPFVLVRVSNESEEPEMSSPPKVSSDDQDNTYLRFRGRKSVSIKVTPMVSQSLAHFEEDIRRNALQRIVITNGHPTIPCNSPETDDFAILDVIPIIQATFDGISTSGSVMKGRFSLEAGFRHSSVTLDMSFDEKTVEPTSLDKFVFSCDIKNPKFSIGGQSIVAGWEESTFHMGRLGPEYIVATGLALAHSAQQLAELWQNWKQYSSLLKRSVVFDIIRCSGDKATVDPLSTIQPSYLVQSGLPHVLRTDTTFRFLYHLRNCLWHLKGFERDTSYLAQNTQQGDPANLLPLLEARLAALDPDSYNLAQLPSLGSLFSILQINNPLMVSADVGFLYNFFTLRFSKLTFIVSDPANKNPSELIVADVDVRARASMGDIVQIPSFDSTTLSQTSLKEKRSQNVLKSSVLVHFGNMTLVVFPHLMGFAQHILRVHRHFLSAPLPTKEPKLLPSFNNSHGSGRFVSVDVLFSLGHLRVQAAAENLVFEFGLSRIRGTSSMLLRPPMSGRQSMSHSVLFDQIFVRARSPSDAGKQSDHDFLASLELSFGKISTITRKELALKTKLDLIFTLGDVQLLVPRSALRLYRFIQEWRADFLPGIEATVQALLSEIHKAPSKLKLPQLQRASSGRPSFQMQGELSHLGIALQVMHGTWLSWDAQNLVAYTNSASTATPSYTFGLQIACVILSISSRPNARDEEPGTRVKLILPPLSATGSYDGSGVETIVFVEFAELKVKPSHWDTLLAVQQKFGQDFHDLVTLIQETNIRRAASEYHKTPRRSQVPLHYNTFVKMRGFRVGFEGPASTVYFECLGISGGINNFNGLTCNVELSDMAFSLASRAVARPSNPGFNRKHRSAFVIIDFKIDARNEPVSDSSTIIQVLVSKIHAVMQPSSIGEVGDFVDHIQAEMLDRKEQRVLELVAFKEKTRRILQTLEVGVQDTLPDTRPWLDSYIINVSTRNIGVAFPLTHDLDLQLPRTGSRDSTSVPAFLWSIKSIEFGTHRGQTGQAEMKLFSFQFISRLNPLSSFRQSVPDDFSGGNHVTRNRLVYPQMKAQLRSTGPSTALSHVYITADVSGFILDLDSSIPSYVFSLIDVYRQGRDRMEKISNSLPRTPSTLDTSNPEKVFQAERTRSTFHTPNLFASMTFRSGKVRVYSRDASGRYQARAFPYDHQELSDEQVMELGAEVFNLPVVSVWAEYHAAPASQRPFSPNEPEPSILMFKSTVHSSRNTLRPTLLPFLTELVKHIEARLRRVSLRTSQLAQTIVEDSTAPAFEQNRIDSTTSLRISFSLRIDQSKLELTCQPDVNVIAGLHWDSGGFVVNVSPGARKITFTGSVGGLTLGLKHGFLSEDCVRLDARNLAFSVAFAKVEGNRGAFGSSFSIVLDTEFLGAVRFSRLQDILCFKAVWLDRIPVFNSPPSAVPAKTSMAPSTSTPYLAQAPKQHFTTIILIRIRRITVDVDLGQSISAMALDLRDAVMRTKLTETLSELSVFVGDLNIIAKGNVAGNVHVPKCVFQTIRSTEGSSSAEGRNRMLELKMTSGPLVVSLESDHQKLLHYRAEPLEIKIFDDWSVTALELEAETRPLQLSFTVKSPDIVVVATVGTIPKLLAYVNKFQANLDAQRIGASRESKAFRITRTPKPDNPLSAVAEAMLVSARSRFKEAENGLIYVIMQHMSLELDFLRLVVFPRTMDDLEIAQFVARDVKARLNRSVESAPSIGKRDVLLSFSSMIISKFTGLGHPQTSELSDGREWLVSLLHGASEAIIVGLPSMTMHMVSEEKIEDMTTTLVYDFHSRFVRQGDSREYNDIYITLNVALYSWLTVLRKNLTREMEQVKASTDWRTLLNTASTQVGGHKKKILEPLSSPRSLTEPSPSNRPFLPFSPTTALKSSMGDPIMGLLSPASSTMSTPRSVSPGLQDFPSIQSQVATNPTKQAGIVYRPRSRHIERLTMRQLGEATPDVMHPFFMKKAGFNLEDSLPQYVNEYATTPLEEIMEVLLKLYSRQLLSNGK